MIGLQSGPTVMMTLGGYQFGIPTAAYQELTRTTEWRWPSQDRYMQGQALQYVGPGGDTMALPGVIYPEYRGGFGQLNAMRAAADRGEPLTMISGDGLVMGRWVIERLEEKQTIFAAAGRPRKQEFTLNLRKFDSTGQGTTTFSGGFSSAAAAIADSTTAPSATDSVQSLASTSANRVAGIAGSISASLNAVQAQASAIGSGINSVLQPISRALGVANNLKASISDARGLLGAIPTTFSAASSLTEMVSAATGAVTNSGMAGTALKTSLDDLIDLGTVSAPALAAVQGALVNVNKLTVASTALESEASAQLASLPQ